MTWRKGVIMMNEEQTFTISEFGRRARITVRTLRFYEELGLLVPTKQNHSGHRLYGMEELARLQQIQSLKFLGYSLQDIKSILTDETISEIEESLPLQHKLLVEKRDELNRAIEAVERVQSLIEEEKPITPTVLTSLLYQIEHEDDQKEWIKENFSDDVADRYLSLSKEQRNQMDTEMLDVLASIKKLIKDGIAPQSQEAFDVLIKLTDVATKHVEDKEELALQLEQIEDLTESDMIDFQFPSFWTKEEEAYLMEIGKAMEAMYREKGGEV
ncbi:MerR family transcriptional regulator [Halalkalibacter sp. APA_J-10(15)]|uniref:MerR family transcriptional regulator n=2 Tax=unclassified Halalkalibacter TaxID=2893063 RepID=UPI001FF56E04|nr:MerR family transcriptional regulator [Halalkalibacter sp. APA_J-10(15)]